MAPTYCRNWLPLLVAAALTGCGDETPARAIYAVAHDLEHRAYGSACERLVPGAGLPADARRALGLTGGEGPAWDTKGEAGCREALEGGTLAGYELAEPRVHSIRTRPLQESAGVTATATAQVSVGGEQQRTIRLALVDGRWRVVPESSRAPP